MADIKRLPCFTIDSESKPGQLLTFVRQFKEANVNLLGVWAFETRPGTGQCYVVAHDSAALRKVLQTSGWKFKETTCFHVTGDDKAGALVEALEPVAKDGINLQAVEGIGVGGKYGAFLFADAKDIDRLGKLLKA